MPAERGSRAMRAGNGRQSPRWTQVSVVKVAVAVLCALAAVWWLAGRSRSGSVLHTATRGGHPCCRPCASCHGRTQAQVLCISMFTCASRVIQPRLTQGHSSMLFVLPVGKRHGTSAAASCRCCCTPATHQCTTKPQAITIVDPHIHACMSARHVWWLRPTSHLAVCALQASTI